MFSKFIEKDFPRVNVKFSRNITDDEDFNNFLNNWLKIYEKKKDFYFIMDTNDTGYVPIKYCLEMSNFINEIRRNEIRYLKFSIILVSNTLISYLLKVIFMVSPPLAPLYIVKTEEEKKKLEDILNQKYLKPPNLCNNINMNSTDSIDYIDYSDYIDCIDYLYIEPK